MSNTPVINVSLSTPGEDTRAIRFPFGDGAGVVLPASGTRANKYLAFGAGGALVTVAGTDINPALEGEVDDLAAALAAADPAMRAGAIAAGAQIIGRKAVPPAGSVTPTIYRTHNFEAGKTYEAVAHVRTGGLPRVQLIQNLSQMPINLDFNLGAGTFGISSSSGSMRPIGDGFYEIIGRGLCTASFTGNFQLRPSLAGTFPFTADGVAGVHIEKFWLREQGGENLWPSDDPRDASFTKTNLPFTSEMTTRVGSDPFYGGLLTMLGTSIESDSQYAPTLAASLGMRLQNLGVGGGSIAAGSHPTGSRKVLDAVASVDPSARLIGFGNLINDFGTSNSVLGAPGDTTDATFCGALYLGITGARAIATSAAIFTTTPYSAAESYPSHKHFWTNSRGYTLTQFQAAQRDVCRMLGVPVILVGEEGPITYLNAGLKTWDGLHPTLQHGAELGMWVAPRVRVTFAAGLWPA